MSIVCYPYTNTLIVNIGIDYCNAYG